MQPDIYLTIFLPSCIHRDQKPNQNKRMVKHCSTTRKSGSTTTTNGKIRLAKLPAYNDIIFEILIRVPAKDVLECKKVCKLWYEVISSGKFARAHFQHWNSTNAPSHMIIYSSHKYSLLNLAPGAREQLYFGYLEDKRVRVLDSLHGLVLFTVPESVNKELYLCNPLTQKMKVVFCSRAPATWKRRAQFYRLVFDPLLQQYKVVGLAYNSNNKNEVSRIVDNSYMVLTVPSADKEYESVWKEVGTAFLHRASEPFSSVAINRVLHFLAISNTPDDNGTDGIAFVQTMDIVREKFTEKIQLPCQPTGKPESWHNFKLLDMRGSLSVTIPVSVSELGLWVRKRDFWLKQHTILLEANWISRGLPRGLKNNPMTLFMDSDGNLSNIVFQLNGRKQYGGMMGYFPVTGIAIYAMETGDLEEIYCFSDHIASNYRYYIDPVIPISTYCPSLIDWN